MGQRIPNIYIKESKLHGRGVFTGVEIPKDSIIEICPMLYLPPDNMKLIDLTIIHDYYFEWGDDLKAGALALGYGSIYNHSYEPNAYYDFDMENNSLSVYALRDIKGGEEITFNYNGDPDDKEKVWFDKPKDTK